MRGPSRHRAQRCPVPGGPAAITAPGGAAAAAVVQQRGRPRIARLAHDGDLHRAGQIRLGDREPPAAAARESPGQRGDGESAAQCRVCVPLRAGQRAVAEQRTRRREPAGRRRVVRRVLRPVQQRFGIIGRVIEAAAAVAEPVERRVEQVACDLTQRASPVTAGEREKSLGHARVVLKHAVAWPVAPSREVRASRTPWPLPRCTAMCSRRAAGPRPPAAATRSGPVEQQAGFRERGDREAVPGGDDLVVTSGPDPGGACGQESGADAAQPFGIICVAPVLEHRTALLERAGPAGTPNTCAAYRASASPSTSASWAGVQT